MTQPYQLSSVPLFRVQDNNNRPLSGGQVFTYVAGTTNPQASYPSPTSGTPNPNPVILNARGEAAIWLDPALTYKVNVLDSGGNQIPGYPVDNIPGGINLTQAGIGLLLYPRTAAEVSAGVTPVNFFYIEGDARRYGVTGNGSTDDTAALNNAFLVPVPITIHSGMRCKVSGALTRAIGLEGIWMEDNSSIDPTGSGYTVLTIINPNWGSRFQLFVNMFNWSIGSGYIGRPALNGIYFKTALAGTYMPRCIVFGLAGFGVVIESVFDSFIGVITTQGCGSASQAAIQINGAGGNDSNFTYFSTLQPEASFNLAISTQGTRGLHIGSLQVEQPSTGADLSVISLTGDMVIDSIYWISNDQGNILINPSNISIGQITYSSLVGASNNYLQLNPGFNPANCRIGLIQSLGATYTMDLKEVFQSATIKYYIGGGNVGTLFVRGANWDVNNLNITTLDTGFSANTYAQALSIMLRRCTIATVNVSQNTSACTFEDCTITTTTAMPGFSVFKGGQINGALTLSSKGIMARDLYISGAVTMTSPTIWDWERVHVVGNVTYSGVNFRHTHRSVQIDGTTDTHLLAAPTQSPSAIADAPAGNVHERTQWLSANPIGWKWNGSAWVAGPNAP